METGPVLASKRDLLTYLSEVGIPLALISNATGPPDIFDADLQQRGLTHYFQTVVWSCAIGFRKPDPRMFEAALAGLGQTPGKHVMMIGDHESADIMGGQQMGFTTVKIISRENSTESLADFVVIEDDLLKWFKNSSEQLFGK